MAKTRKKIDVTRESSMKDEPRTLFDTIGMRYGDAKEFDLDWTGYVPIIDRTLMRITGILDTSGDTSGYFFVEVVDWLTWRMNGNDAAIKKETGDARPRPKA